MFRLKDLFVIVGLGNPGRRYEGTRHNVGFETVEILSKRHGIKLTKLRHKAILGEGLIGGKKIILVKPQTFMNLSGDSVWEILQWYRVSQRNMIVVYDDVDLPLGKLRLRPRGSSGTHNGMKSVIYRIESDEFFRIRIGIGSPPKGWELSDYVLGKFHGADKEMIASTIIKASDATEEIIRSGIDSAMNKFNIG